MDRCQAFVHASLRCERAADHDGQHLAFWISGSRIMWQ